MFTDFSVPLFNSIKMTSINCEFRLIGWSGPTSSNHKRYRYCCFSVEMLFRLRSGGAHFGISNSDASNKLIIIWYEQISYAHEFWNICLHQSERKTLSIIFRLDAYNNSNKTKVQCSKLFNALRCLFLIQNILQTQ